mmetsp:Transcript_3833/g.8943  ORF Transcript_3833/g.8943 Transcript_3833/m.8943 type:complete len:191 (+) Transcript_3833:429-1001(+)
MKRSGEVEERLGDVVLRHGVLALRHGDAVTAKGLALPGHGTQAACAKRGKARVGGSGADPFSVGPCPAEVADGGGAPKAPRTEAEPCWESTGAASEDTPASTCTGIRRGLGGDGQAGLGTDAGEGAPGQQTCDSGRPRAGLWLKPEEPTGCATTGGGALSNGGCNESEDRGESCGLQTRDGVGVLTRRIS